MAFKPFPQVQIDDRAVSLFQSNTANAFASLQSSAIAAGQLISNLFAASVGGGSDFTIQHNLGRVPLGILPCVSSLAGLSISTSPTQNPMPKSSAILRASVQIPAGTTLAFWVL